MAELSVSEVERFARGELVDLCAAMVAAIEDGIGFGWVTPPPRHRLEAYWRGVILVPERVLLLGHVDGSVAGSVQLIKPSANFEAGHFATHIDTHFVAPWARGHGLARLLLEAAETAARDAGFRVMRLDVRVIQERAIKLYESCGYERWGVLDRYHEVDGEMVAGAFFIKNL